MTFDAFSFIVLVTRITAACLVLLLGYFFGSYVKRHIKKKSAAWGEITGKTVFYFIVFLSFAFSLPLVGISKTFASTIILIFVGSISIGAIMAIGLGIKDSAFSASQRYIKKRRL